MLDDLFPAQRTKHVKYGDKLNAAHLKQALGPIIRQHRGGNSKAGNHQICQHCSDEIWIEIYRDVSRCLNPNSLSETRLGLAWIGFFGGGKATKSTNKPKPNNFGGYRLPRSYKHLQTVSGEIWWLRFQLYNASSTFVAIPAEAPAARLHGIVETSIGGRGMRKNSGFGGWIWWGYPLVMSK